MDDCFDATRQAIAQRITTSRRFSTRMSVISAAEGLQVAAIVAATGKNQLAVRRWYRRFMAKGVEGLLARLRGLGHICVARLSQISSLG
jgi:hypothetical protein